MSLLRAVRQSGRVAGRVVLGMWAEQSQHPGAEDDDRRPGFFESAQLALIGFGSVQFGLVVCPAHGQFGRWRDEQGGDHRRSGRGGGLCNCRGRGVLSAVALWLRPAHRQVAGEARSSG